MDTSALKKFAQSARRQLREQVAARLEQILRLDSIEAREKKAAIAELRAQIEKSSKPAVIDQVAYTWFNRLCALRFMDANHYTRLGIVSPQAGFTQPEILQEAKQGVIDADFPVDRQRVFSLLNGQLPSANPQQEAYRLLLVAACNFYYTSMPFMFEKIEDYTELLMPADLLSANSVLHDLRQALTPEACQDVEVIGWLYQYYISERKDEVFENLKKNIKIEAEDIPAATQLFTPHWIVCYLVENSLGRLWMLNHPDSKLVEHMQYYIRPEQDETDFLKIASPEEIKLCDPACGSGHMLTYAFDLMYLIYAEAGYDAVEIPRLILQNNLFGIEIDPRAGALAAFALAMKARAKDRRFFQRDVTPNICVLENIEFIASEIDAYMNVVGRDLFTQDFWLTLKQFENAHTFGSLIRPQLKDVATIRKRLQEKGIFENLFLHGTNQKVQRVLTQVEYLSPRYHVVVANPPYMGWSGMSLAIREFAKDHFINSKSDMGIMFIERIIDFIIAKGTIGMITMHNWMFLTSYEQFRSQLLNQRHIITMAHLGANAFDSIGGEVVSTTAFIIQKLLAPEVNGVYLRLIDGNNESEKQTMLQANLPKSTDLLSELCFRASSNDFRKIPGSPIAYWISENVRKCFDLEKLGDLMPVRSGLTSGDKPKFTRAWWEVQIKTIGFNKKRDEAINSSYKWFPHNAGGEAKRWYGNRTLIIDWEHDGLNIRNQPNSTIRNPTFYFTDGITWTDISTRYFSARLIDGGFVFENTGSMVFPKDKFIPVILCYLSSSPTTLFMNVMNPTMHFGVGEVAKLPFDVNIAESERSNVQTIFNKCISISKSDWDSHETSWNYMICPFSQLKGNDTQLSVALANFFQYWQKTTLEIRVLEEENNLVLCQSCFDG